ncbi:acyl-CoA N-acyltransferase [Chaetomidium leptoderma]|uniref:Acyl-CoA N-acyltransferase n=1 Tax=Chaetomidium leptoderma TaxID=669021 RepID=A0AAN6VJB0_9PEZI|nr:acyl-CoA N-acyltransferase [Chaetomidium leptoderma]
MGTPFIALLEPTPLAWERALPPASQPASASIPRTFLDAMTVRSEVFVQEQNIPQSNEFDPDDPRCAHWVIYASVNQTIAPAVTDPTTGEVIRPRQSETKSLPIGTVRLVPFPHPPHPRKGGVYVDGELINTTTTTTPPNGDTPLPVQPLTSQEQEQARRASTIPTFTPDRPTTLHDGREPYVKLGRLAVTKEFRGRGLAGQLVRTAVDWMRKHPSYFDPSPAERGFEHLGMEQGGTLPRWNGLFCCHAQVDAVRAWEKSGFQVDQEMGEWMEEGIPHVGMFLRVQVEPEAKQV